MVRRAKKRPAKRAVSRKSAARAPVAATRPEGVTAAEAAGRALWTNKIFPRNLTAQAAYLVPGNPVVTRPEDAVANCFPGLELDIRNLDRRFFPGLVFNFVTGGARLE